MYNKIILMGRIVADPEIKTTPQGVNFCSFRIAVDRRFQQKCEEKKTDFFNVTAWRTTAEFITRYFSKGRMILIEGELQTSQYTDKNGNNATWYEINAERVSFTGEPKSAESSSADPAPLPAADTAAASATPTFQSATADDDYPF